MRRVPPYEIKGPGGALQVRAEDTAAVDLAMLIEGETSGRPLEEVLAVYGRSRSTYYEKLRRFREHGFDGLHSRPPGPRTAWRRPLEILRFVVTSRIRHPDQSAADIAAALERLGHRLSVRSVERTLSQFGLTRTARPTNAAKPPEETPAPRAELDGALAAPPTEEAAAPERVGGKE
jgi:transposase